MCFPLHPSCHHL
jgi:hypothetical protein